MSVNPGDLGSKVLGSAGNVPWPAGFSSLIGPVALAEVNNMKTTKAPLSSATVKFLGGVADRNPQYAPLVERIFEENNQIAGGIPRNQQVTGTPTNPALKNVV
jgi:hypothetical protein